MKTGILIVWIGAIALSLAGLFCPGNNVERILATAFILTVAYVAVKRKNDILKT